MLTLERCRKILGPECLLSDEELEALRNQLYALADIVLVACAAKRLKWEEQDDMDGEGGSDL